MHFKAAAIVAAGLAAQQATATGWSVDASSYSSPSNTNNQCSEPQKSGYDWSGLQPGDFNSYGSNKFHGWSCSNSFNKRDSLTKRHFQNKCIKAGLHDQPSISCHEEEHMSINEMQVSSSHDADVECHYGMPDGSICKETHSCSTGGSIIKNTQCGGAKSVTFKPGHKAPSGCSIGVHSVGFHCGTSSSTAAVSTPTVYSSVSTPVSTSSEATTTEESTTPAYPTETSSVPAESTTPAYPTETSSAPVESSTPAYPTETSSVPVESSTPAYPTETSSVPAESTIPVYPTETSSAPVESSTPAYGTMTSVPVESSPVTSSVPAYGTMTSVPVESSPVTSSVPVYGTETSSVPVESSPVTSSVPVYQPVTSSVPATSSAATPSEYTTSTVYSTTVEQHSTGVITKTIAVSTTVCPVTATETPASVSPSSYYGNATSSTADNTTPTPSCPGLLPKCMNTWMHETGCKDNTDASCYCKDESFVKDVMTCLTAWGTESEAMEASSYFQGICAAYIPQNPALVTACPTTTPATSETPASTPVGPATITKYSTQEITVTSCAAYVTNCPADSTTVVTTSVPIITTVETYPATSAPITSAPVTSAPATYGPVTTVTYSSVVTVPATYSNGPSAGNTIPASSYATTIVSTLTVPQVQFTTQPATAGQTGPASVGLGSYPTTGAAGPMTTNPAAGTAPYGTTFGTSWTPKPTGTTPVGPYTGAGVKLSSRSMAGVAFGAVAAFFLL